MEVKLCLDLKMVKSCPRDLDSNVTSPIKKDYAQCEKEECKKVPVFKKTVSKKSLNSNRH